MRLDPVICNNAPEHLVNEFSSKKFYLAFMEKVVRDCLGEFPGNRPGEFIVERPLVASGHWDCVGIRVVLKEVTRDGRTGSSLNRALEALDDLISETVLDNAYDGEVQTQVIMELDAEIESPPDSGKYSRILFAKPQRFKGGLRLTVDTGVKS